MTPIQALLFLTTETIKAAVCCPSGVKVLHDVLTNSLPDAFFPGPMPYSSGDGYTIQSLCSVQVDKHKRKRTVLQCPTVALLTVASTGVVMQMM